MPSPPPPTSQKGGKSTVRSAIKLSNLGEVIYLNRTTQLGIRFFVVLCKQDKNSPFPLRSGKNKGKSGLATFK